LRPFGDDFPAINHDSRVRENSEVAPACVQKVKDRQHGVTPGAILVAVNICPMKPRENLRKTQGKPQLN